MTDYIESIEESLRQWEVRAKARAAEIEAKRIALEAAIETERLESINAFEAERVELLNKKTEAMNQVIGCRFIEFTPQKYLSVCSVYYGGRNGSPIHLVPGIDVDFKFITGKDVYGRWQVLRSMEDDLLLVTPGHVLRFKANEMITVPTRGKSQGRFIVGAYGCMYYWKWNSDNMVDAYSQGMIIATGPIDDIPYRPVTHRTCTSHILGEDSMYLTTDGGLRRIVVERNKPFRFDAMPICEVSVEEEVVPATPPPQQAPEPARVVPETPEPVLLLKKRKAQTEDGDDFMDYSKKDMKKAHEVNILVDTRNKRVFFDEHARSTRGGNYASTVMEMFCDYARCIPEETRGPLHVVTNKDAGHIASILAGMGADKVDKDLARICRQFYDSFDSVTVENKNA
jgi:hypothetical protein